MDLLTAALAVAVVVPSENLDLHAGLDRLAADIERSAGQAKMPKIAVCDFESLRGSSTSLGQYIALRLMNRLAEGRVVQVVDRTTLGRALQAERWSMKDLAHPENAKRAVELLGIQALVVGTIVDLGSAVELDARLVVIETSTVKRSTTVVVAKDATVQALLSQDPSSPGTSASTVPLAGGQSTAVSAETGVPAGSLFFNEVFGQSGQGRRPGVQVVLESIESKGTRGITFHFVLVGDPRDRRVYVSLHEPSDNTSLRDNNGTNYRLEGSTLRGDVPLEGASRKRVDLSFAALKPDAKKIHLTTAFKVTDGLVLPAGDFFATRAQVVPIEVLDVKVEDFKR